MKPVKLILYFLTGFVVLALVAVAFVFTSGFQTWAARKALAGQPGLHATLGRVSAGLGRVDLEAVHAEPNGAILTLPALHVELPLVSAGLSKKVEVSKLVAKGWMLDLSKTKPTAPLTATPAAPAPSPTQPVTPAPSAALAPVNAPASPSPADSAIAATTQAFRGVFSMLKLPVDLSLDGVDLEGDVILPPTPGAQPARAHVRLVGGGLAAGREGRFTVDLAVAFTGEKLPVSALAVHLTLIAAMDTPRTFTRLEAETDAAAKGEKFPGGVKLVATVVAARSATGESYSALIVLEGKEVVSVHTDFPSDGRTLSGTWKLNARTADLAPFALGRALPEVNAVGEGKFSTDSSFAETHASGQLDANADQLAVIKPELAALGAVKLSAEFDLAQRGGALRIDRLAAQLTGAQPVAKVQSLQPFEFNAKTGELKVAEPARELLAINLQAVPLAWVQPFLKGYTLAGGDLHGEFTATASNGGLALRPKGPLAVAGLSLASATGPLVRALDVALTFTADYTPQGWQAEIAPLTLTSAGAPLFSFDAKAGQLIGKDQPLKATGHWSANLPVLLAQPFAAGQAALVQGEASGEFLATLAAKKELNLKIALKQLVADPKLTKDTLPTMTLDVRADVDTAGKISFHAPVVFERAGRKSDLALNGTALPGTAKTTLDVTVASALLVVDDLQILAALAPAKASVTETAPSSKPDEKPFWAAVSGQFTLALKKVVYSEKFEVNDVGGTVRLEDGALKFDGVRAGFGEEGAMKLNGGVTFVPKTAVPYALKAEFALSNFDSGPLFRAIRPTELPQVEGKFNVLSHLAGDGANASQLAERTRGEFEVTSKAGLFRGLSADMADSLKQGPSMLSGAVSGVGALLGLKKEKMQDATEYLDKQGKVVVEIADRLKEIAYDQINVVANRDEKLNIVLKEFSLIAPEVRLRGTGQITFREGAALLAQPLALRLRLGARGRLENLMNNVGLLDSKQDELGYTNLVEPLNLGGTLENIDKSGLKKLLTDAAIKKAKSSLLDNLGGLLGR